MSKRDVHLVLDDERYQALRRMALLAPRAKVVDVARALIDVAMTSPEVMALVGARLQAMEEERSTASPKR